MNGQPPAEFDGQTKAAIDSASDTAKQLITLATGVLALEISFAKEVASTHGATEKWLLGWSWVVLLASVVAGVWTLLALTGTLGGRTVLTPKAIYARNVCIPATLQILLFLVGLLLTVLFGIWSV